MTVASILSPWILQKYWKVPDVVKVWEKDAPLIRTPECQRPSGFPTAPEVTVCPLSPPLVHSTVSPTEMVSVVGSKNLSPIDKLCVLGSVVVGRRRSGRRRVKAPDLVSRGLTRHPSVASVHERRPRRFVSPHSYGPGGGGPVMGNGVPEFTSC